MKRKLSAPERKVDDYSLTGMKPLNNILKFVNSSITPSLRQMVFNKTILLPKVTKRNSNRNGAATCMDYSDMSQTNALARDLEALRTKERLGSLQKKPPTTNKFN